ncbi:MAG: DUF2279 domain-containing protein [Saprospiraceae bacterium]|nr:DUF2279 domain-containing protein [Saprospiraceae bacterium]
MKAQKRWIQVADSSHSGRVYLAAGLSALSYSAFSVGLYHAWYKDFHTGRFRSFNDWAEWRYMDKLGHLYSGYFQSDLIYQLARWTGQSKETSIWTGMGVSLLFLSTVEVYDGFSRAWGFSWTDVSANVLGVGFFGLQQAVFDRQIASIKFSAPATCYPMEKLISERRKKLFGNNMAQIVLKDYNRQIYWLSFHPGKWVSPIPWLNLAIGYGAEGLYGGFQNRWTEADGSEIRLDPSMYPRYSQIYFSLDLNLKKIPIKNPWWRSFLSMVQVVKIPAPALEFNTLGQIRAHWWK